VSNFNNSISTNERDELVEQNKIFITRLTNLKKTNLNQIRVIESNELITKRLTFGNHNFNKDVIIRKIEIIGDDEVIVKTGNKQDQGKEILFINCKKAKEIVVGQNDGGYLRQEFCWIYHLKEIFCFLKDFSNQKKFALFSKETGNLIRVIDSTDCHPYEVDSVSYNKNNYELYLNVFNTIDTKSSILILDKDFVLIKKLRNDLYNPDLPLNFVMTIELFNAEYKTVHYKSNFAFCQKRFRLRNYCDDEQVKNNHTITDDIEELYSYSIQDIHIFDKSSYSFVGVIHSQNELITILNGKMLFRTKSGYLIQNIPLFKSNLPDNEAFCKIIDPFREPHLLSNPYLLPCGGLACLNCIQKRYNLFKRSFDCEICKEEHNLPQKLEPLNSSKMRGLLNEDLLNILSEKNKTAISNIGI
jgi:hypothetical protein